MNKIHEIFRRRTLAIVSHPDAGKTTLTEKLLLYGGAVQLAGSVTARKKQRSTTSDWMELERKRGISISSTVLNFDYEGFRINLLDTPGHKDFSEDTYRVLTAVDAAIMVIDAGKGIESQTRKLFEVCRLRKVPIFTFINKMDRPSREPLELLDELENVLGIGAYPMNWPLGTGDRFKGIWDRRSRLAHFFDRTPGGMYPAPVSTCGMSDPVVRKSLDETTFGEVCEEVEILNEAGVSYDSADVLAARTTPVFFGSALNNFGVQGLLDGFIELSAPPMPRISRGNPVAPERDAFSGFVFKIQANMDPNHRDRIVFIRVVSGRFTRDMTVTHVPTGKKVRLSNSNKMFGRDRETIDEAYPGDVIGIAGAKILSIGDTLSEDPTILFNEIPRFPPECFAFLHNEVPSNHKRFRDGLNQLLTEKVVHAFELPDAHQRIPLLAAVGPLQFEIVQYRLATEYGASSRIEEASWTMARWIRAGGSDLGSLMLPSGVRIGRDGSGLPVLLFPSQWHVNYFQQHNTEVELSAYPPSMPETEAQRVA
ncbi:MAG TPA: peptide chain release factor 3 [Deltaproteobacteria bacterium]|nr:peptide chain release factor 3 [Deltaproteobacteria bacterium]HDP24926.1 peptide chain release factor 3 [Deltaproteobacteria bacterium]